MPAAPPAKPRLLVLSSTYPRFAGDPEPGFVHELARRLCARFEVTVLCPHARGARTAEVMDSVRVLRFRYAPEGLETLVNSGGMATNLRVRPWKWLLVPAFVISQAVSLLQVLRTWRPDVVHAHWLIPQGFLIAFVRLLWRSRVPFVVTSHGADLYALRSAPLQAAKRFVIRRAAALTVVSEGMRKEIHGLQPVDDALVTVAPMGVDLEGRFVPDPNVPRSPSEILFVGRLVEKKGLRFLLEAMPGILESFPDASLVVVGFGPEEDMLRRRVAELSLERHVRFEGPVPQAELPAYYRRAAVFVAPFVEAHGGDQEGLGLVTIEAIGCDCPAVVSDLPATKGLPAARVVPGSAEALAAAVCEVLSASAAHRAACAREARLAVQRFDWSAVGRMYGDLLASVAGATP